MSLESPHTTTPAGAATVGRDDLPKGSEILGILRQSGLIPSFCGLAVILGYLAPVLHFRSEHLVELAILVAVLTAFCWIPLTYFHYNWSRPLAQYLDARREGEVVQAENAFVSVMELPRRCFVLSAMFWISLGVAAPYWLYERFDDVNLHAMNVMLAAAVSGGVVTSILLWALLTRTFAPVRGALARELPDTELRSHLVRPISVSSKLLVSLTGVLLCGMVFAVVVSEIQGDRNLEGLLVSAQQGVVERAAAEIADGRYPAAVLADAQVAHSEILTEILLLELDLPENTSASQALQPSELRSIRESKADSGDSRKLETDNGFAWARVPGDGSRVLVAVQRLAATRTTAGGSRTVISILVAISLVIGVLIARYVAHAFTGTVSDLHKQIARVTAGDLAAAGGVESDDEMGDLARSIEDMTGALRRIVQHIGKASERMDGAALEISRASQVVSAASESQATGIASAADSVGSINGQILSLAEASSEMATAAEESSSSVMELKVVGRQVDDASETMSQKAEETSTSIEELARSIDEISRSTEALATAAQEASSNTERLAGEIQNAKRNAAETEGFSASVVAAAESGHERVQQTIEGMEAIRESSDAAETVVESLGTKIVEIGAITDVIRSVADETGLLALNAAIISAQAGEHGRSFGVVAGEIKSLASRVLQSTREIGGVIAGLQEEAQQAIDVIRQGAPAVREGVKLCAGAGASLEDITASAHRSGEHIAEIVSSVRAQAQVADEVAEQIQRVHAGVEEIRRAAVEQGQGGETLVANAGTTRECSDVVRRTSTEQQRTTDLIAESFEGVRDTSDRMRGALGDQSVACNTVSEFLEEMRGKAGSYQSSVRSMEEQTDTLAREAAALREFVEQYLG